MQAKGSALANRMRQAASPNQTCADQGKSVLHTLPADPLGRSDPSDAGPRLAFLQARTNHRRYRTAQKAAKELGRLPDRANRQSVRAREERTSRCDIRRADLINGGR